MSRARDWCKLHERWYSSKKVRRLTRKYGPVAGGYWALLIARAYTESHHADNPCGVIQLALQDLADDLYDHHDRTGLFEAMVSARLIVIRGDGWKSDLASEVEVELVDFAGEQHPKGSSARRQLERRERDRAENSGASGETSQVVTQASQVVTTCTQTEREKEIEKESDSTTPPVRAHAGAPAHEAAAGGGGDGENQLERIASEIRRYRRDLGNLAFDVDSAVAAITDDRGNAPEPTWLLHEIYRPAASMLHEYGRDATRAALAAIVNRPDVAKPQPYMRAVAERAAAEVVKPAKPVQTFAQRKADADKAAMLASLRVPPVVNPEAV